MSRRNMSFAVAVLWTLMTAGAALGARKTALQGTPPERLLALVEKSERIAVIVTVQVEDGWDLSATRQSEKAIAQRQKARDTKERILRTHPSAKRIADRDFEFIPAY